MGPPIKKAICVLLFCSHQLVTCFNATLNKSSLHSKETAKDFPDCNYGGLFTTGGGPYIANKRKYHNNEQRAIEPPKNETHNEEKQKRELCNNQTHENFQTQKKTHEKKNLKNQMYTNVQHDCESHQNESHDNAPLASESHGNFVETTSEYSPKNCCDNGDLSNLKYTHEPIHEEKGSPSNIMFINRGIFDYFKKKRKKKGKPKPTPLKQNVSAVNNANETQTNSSLYNTVIDSGMENIFDDSKYLKFYYPIRSDATVTRINTNQKTETVNKENKKPESFEEAQAEAEAQNEDHLKEKNNNAKHVVNFIKIKNTSDNAANPFITDQHAPTGNVPPKESSPILSNFSPDTTAANTSAKKTSHSSSSNFFHHENTCDPKKGIYGRNCPHVYNSEHAPRPMDDFDLQRVLSDYKPDDVDMIKKMQQTSINPFEQHLNYGDFNLSDAIRKYSPSTPYTPPNPPYPPNQFPNAPPSNNANSCNINNRGPNQNPNTTTTNYNTNVNTNTTMNNDKHLSLRYLGLGYDIILGNPEGEPGLNIDPGYRGPILQLNIENMDAVADKTRIKKGSLIPWVIPEHSCNQSKNVEEIKSLDQYKTELSSDVSVSTPTNIPYSFSASVEFKNALNKLKLQNNVLFMMKIYCLRYYSGIPISKQWKFTKHVQKALSNLPDTFEGLNEESQCSYKDYKLQIDSPECEKNVNKWINFFRLYGTHITHELYLGGKIILKVHADRDVYSTLKQKNINMKSLFQTHFSRMGFGLASSKVSDSMLSKYNLQKNVSILGGNPGLNVEDTVFFEKWVQSIVTNSMPIKTKLIPFSYFMNDPNMVKAYKDALTFYGLSYGIRIIDQEQYNNHVLSIGSYLEQCTQMIYSGSTPGLLTCPRGSSILMGFSLNLDFNSKKQVGSSYGLFPCEQLKESCSGNALDSSTADTRIWALCSTNPVEFITQIVEQAQSPKLTATCPNGLVILFGFALMKGVGHSSASHVDIYPCRTGQVSCTAVLQTAKFKQSMIYIACVDKTTKDLEHLQTYSQVQNFKSVSAASFKNDGHLHFNCPELSKLIFGFSIEFHTNFPLTRSNFLHCSKTANVCDIGGIGVNSKLSFFRSDRHSLATLAVCQSEK